MSAPQILVAGIGNIFLGDDGFGPEVLRRMGGRTLPPGVRAVDYGIRGMHLSYDLLGSADIAAPQELIIVDAVPDRGSPGTLRAFEVTAEDLDGGAVDPHSMDPGSVLISLGALGGELPRTIVVGCQVFSVEDGIGLSPPLLAVVDDAVELVLDTVDLLVTTAESSAEARG
ncbi:hydrogenase maturation protease [Rhodococcus sp. H36-A4]|uniref:hydrogenase maturation protease n=1 Tax=Rhodococcus sp. H36-A4 TaxID=3004353 RepID=UPI0022AED389|nr:hydrogenase maturation protease [Rhodococcus sp. H36-A4]MCZ4077139.1 hydrogenase maturation protease [Rhodococcus sp. H36-A4]